MDFKKVVSIRKYLIGWLRNGSILNFPDLKFRENSKKLGRHRVQAPQHSLPRTTRWLSQNFLRKNNKWWVGDKCCPLPTILDFISGKFQKIPLSWWEDRMLCVRPFKIVCFFPIFIAILLGENLKRPLFRDQLTGCLSCGNNFFFKSTSLK